MKQPAFTLLEVIIVITIIGIMTGLVFLDFNRARSMQEVDIVTQESLALLDQSRAMVDFGKFKSGNENYLCLGAYFEKGELPRAAEMDYNPILENCDFESRTNKLYGLGQGSVFVEEIDAGGSQEAIWAMFVPPYAALVLYDEYGANFGGDASLILRHELDKDLSRQLYFSSIGNRVRLENNYEE